MLQEGEKITLTVPVQYHGIPVGQVDEGGDTQYNVHELTISCFPKDIPSHLDVNVEHLTIGDAIHVSDLDVPDVEFEDAPERTLVVVLPPRLEPVEEEEEGLEGLLGEGEEVEPEAGAPEDEEEV